MVNVTHDRDNWWTNNKIRLGAFILAKLKMEGAKQFTIFIFG